MSDEDILGMLNDSGDLMLDPYALTAAQMKNWTSEVYAHYQLLEVIHKDDTVCYVFVCKRHIYKHISYH
jgi:hypothetical protein